MKVIEGDLLAIETGIIVQQVNCMGVMGRGLAKTIREKWPTVFKSYHRVCNEKKKDGREDQLLGTVQLVSIKDSPPIRVANLFGQFKYAGTGLHTNYDAVEEGLRKLNLVNYKKLPVYIPYKMSSDLAGGDWKVILSIIEETIPDATIVVLPQFVKELGDNWVDKVLGK